MISQNITKKIAEAMKQGDEVKLSTLRMLSSALNYEKIAKQHELSEEEEISVVRREVKKRIEAIEAYRKAGAEDRVEREEKELLFLKEYLPPEIDDNELDSLVKEAIAETNAHGIGDMGRVMGLVMKKVKGKAEGSRVASKVREALVEK